MREDPSTDDRRPPRQPPLQFRLRTLLAITVALSLLFASLRWLGVPPQASVIVLAVLSVSVLAALGLLLVIAGSVGGDEEED